ncbi:YSIRK-type signal peptide-containing protein [Staphylococcus epidermidis]|uniref:YSIRK-targeted triacylglycerol lipase n=1 Tax=Staphylococcus epidermidis TaxID=1282 RepID=UPI00124C3835|nr:YSIRK-type signal peptide-containing protein [Staphylococcus epidermidis]KAB2225274.1 YSIRK-type signal peptide-containing protein [Staphylococcus epidermidis]MCG1980447.1 YSIRK-type signal peptide-containing protein [Staphylococcus epidermidis]MCG1991634.1 YSIRK-type signal peptide-containing protein [Staphylococcus epidermidis]MCG1996080.1 YSIRK-type signal peptide-containing protein [Staphylococcus epidermidis]MDU6556884.1 YSIRK-type signal peptide-containing protein [Staphylococcus epid
MKNNNRIKRFSIRKYAVGVVSIITGVTIFIGGQQAQAAEISVQHADAHPEDSQTTQQLKNDKVEETLKDSKQGTADSQKVQTIDQSKTNQNNQHSVAESAQLKSDETANQPKVEEESSVKQDIQPSKNVNQQDVATQSNERENNDIKGEDQTSKASNQHTQSSNSHNQSIGTKDSDSEEIDQPLVKLQKPSNDSTYQTQSKAKQDSSKQLPQEKTTKHQIQTTENEQTTNVDSKKTNDTQDARQHTQEPKNDTSTSQKNHHQVATKEQSNRSTTRETQKQSANSNQNHQSTHQAQFKNQYPVVFVHGFLGFAGDNQFSLAPKYWGGTKYNIDRNLTNEGYNVHEANIGAFSSNYDRAVELYYYVKGGRVDYGAAHAAKYGHHRYGRTYKGIMRNWEPGKKIHFIGHSMGGQTIRQMEEFLRNGNQEEIEYQRQHGGTISDLFTGGKDNMVASITTLGTPHNGTPAADKIGTRKLVKETINRIGRLSGGKDVDIDLGFSQWGLKQQPNESYIDYAERVSKSKIWNTEDQAVNDLTTQGAEKINQQTSLNPNIVYTTYTGSATHTGPLGNELPNSSEILLLNLTSRIIGKDANKEIRPNDGVVPVISSQHPSNQAFKKVDDHTPATDKGVWQVRPVQHDWDHLDLVGMDAFDLTHTGRELGQFYLGIMDNIMRIEEADGITNK